MLANILYEDYNFLKKLIDIIDHSVGSKLKKNISDFALDESMLDEGLDSIGFITMIIDIEEAYDIFIDDDGLMFENLSTIGDIKKYIESKLESTIE